MNKNTKTSLIVIGIVGVVLAIVELSYAYWLVTRGQTNINVVTAKCLDISFTGENDINLIDQFPITDEEGMATTPYTFTITNNCHTEVDYQVALESIGNELNSLQASSIKAVIDSNEPKLLSGYTSVDPTQDNAYASHKLTTGTLAANGSEGDAKTYNLYLWLDINTPVSENGKTYSGKITVTIGQGIEHIEEKYAYLWYDGSNVYGPAIGGDASSLSTSAPSGKNYYLKFKLDDTNKVTNSYACAIFGGEEYCVEGGNSSYYGWDTDAAHSTGNVKILYDIQSANITGFSCYFDSGRSDCYVGSVYLRAYPNGIAESRVGPDYCYAGSGYDGDSSYCTGE